MRKYVVRDILKEGVYVFHDCETGKVESLQFSFLEMNPLDLGDEILADHAMFDKTAKNYSPAYYLAEKDDYEDSIREFDLRNYVLIRKDNGYLFCSKRPIPTGMMGMLVKGIKILNKPIDQSDYMPLENVATLLEKLKNTSEEKSNKKGKLSWWRIRKERARPTKRSRKRTKDEIQKK